MSQAKAIGRFALAPVSGPVGAHLKLRGEGFPPGKTLALLWKTKEGRYEVVAQSEFIGQRYEEVLRPIGEARTDPSGAFDISWVVPEDFGGAHEVLIMDGGTQLNSAWFGVKTVFSISPTQGEVGDLITVSAEGLGWEKFGATWQVLYDNKFAGLMTAVTTRGTAKAVLRAAGEPGKHVIQVWRNPAGIPFLNPQQGPYGPLPPNTFVFTVTGEGDVPASYTEESGTEAPLLLPPLKDIDPKVRLSVSPISGPVGTLMTITGEGASPQAKVDLLWCTRRGNRVTSGGFVETAIDLTAAIADERGRFQLQVSAPDDLGNTHWITARVGDQELARAAFTIRPSIVSISPTSGPAGTPITLHIKGGGWTEYDNTYAVLYDNAYIGYVCGFNSKGDIQFQVPASGAPGLHLIDLVPAIYEGEDKDPNIYRRPMLTYRSDFPARRISALRFAFRITEK